VYYYEQSALIKCLRSRNFHLHPTHSHTHSTTTTTLPHSLDSCEQQQDHTCHSHTCTTARVRILPCSEFNCNKICATVVERSSDEHTVPSTLYSTCTCNAVVEDSDYHTHSLTHSTCAKFIFHAVGKWNKLSILLHVVSVYSLLTQSEIDTLPSEFRIRRGRCGGVV